MDSGDFFILSKDWGKNPAMIGVTGKSFDPDKVKRGLETPQDSDLTFKQIGGGKFGRLIDANSLGFYCVEKSVIEAMKAAGLTGWKSIPITIHSKKNKIYDSYSILSITGRSETTWQDFHSREVIPPPTPGLPSQKGWKGIQFDMNKWDGSDLFIPDEKGHILCTPRAKIVLEKALEFVTFEKCCELVLSFYGDRKSNKIIYPNDPEAL